MDSSSFASFGRPYRETVLQRLKECGVPKEQLEQLQPGLVAFVKENKDKLKDIAEAVKPTDSDVIVALEGTEDEGVEFSTNPGGLESLFSECLEWFRWLMFEDKPNEGLKSLGKRGMGERGVCGAVWEDNDIAYQCRTCELDPTCAICGPCFHDGNHKDHDYSAIYIEDGCCDCGDETVWKREGFCSKHKGTDQIQPLPEEIACSVGPVLDALFTYWEKELLYAENGDSDLDDGHMEVHNELTTSVVEMLLEFCEHSGSLLSFVSRRMFLLGVLVRAERFLNKEVTIKLHELLLKFLGDPLFKYDFAKIFIKYYQETIEEAIKEGSDSVIEKYRLVSTFSVQIFTVPTLTPRLVKEMNLLGRLFRCLEDLFHSCAGEEGHLQVRKWAGLYETTNRLVEDTCYVLSHVEVLKYVVHEKPDITKSWMRVLTFFQCMDPQKRATDVHVEEEILNMHFPFALGSCIADIHALLVKEAFSVEENIGDVGGGSLPPTVTWLTCQCLRAIGSWLGCNAVSKDNRSSLSQDISVLSLSDWPDIVYDVSKQAISIHIPLHRLLSVLLHKAMKKCYGDTGALEMGSCSSASPSLFGHFHDFFGQVLRGCHPFGFSAYVMEHPLRIKVFCAEVCAGLWQRNGDVAPVNCEYYRSARWSEQGLEHDIFLLQCCAALAPPDPFVKRILDRFGLSNYLSLDLKQPNEHEPVLVQEMLTLIIQIIKERRFCGLSTAESLRRELVCKLAIGDATHSQLVKSLPQDLSKNDQLQVILDSVADYSNPSGIKQGKYSLRKTCWEELDLYHPRWDSRDFQVAEERYLLFCKVSALAAQLPRWTNAYYPLHGISRIATSRALMEIVRAVLFYAVFTEKTSESRAPDGVVLIALHLLSLGLDICSLQRQTSDQSSSNLSYFLEGYPIPLLDFSTEEIPAGATNGSGAVQRKSLLSLLVLLMRMHKKETFEAGQCNLSSLVASLLKKLAELNVVCMMELQGLAPELVSHLMHPIPSSDVHKSAPISDADERKRKARERQAAMMDKMKTAQSKFMESLKPEENEDVDVSKSKQQQLNSDTRIHVSEEMAPAVCSLCQDPDSKSPLSFLILLQKSRLASFVERGLLSCEQAHPSDDDRSSSKINFSPLPVAGDVQWPSTSHDTSMDTSSSMEMMEVDIYQAILRDMQDKFSTEHDEEGITTNRHTESTLLGKYLASLSRETLEHPLNSRNSRGENASSNTSVRFSAFDGFGPTDCNGIHVSSCGHAVHQECRDRYLSSLRERSEGRDVLDPDQGEFLCPVCRRLGNSVLPACKVEHHMISSDFSSVPTIGSSSTSQTNVLRLAQALSFLRSAGNMVGNIKMHRTLTLQPTLEPVFSVLSRMYFPNRHEELLASGRVSHSMLLWDTLKYSLVSAEITARGGKSNMSAGSSTSGLEALYRELDSSSGFILSLLLKVFQNTRSESALQVLLRFLGIQLFAQSICYGVSTDEISPGSGYQKGTISSVLKHIDKGDVYPDTQFWRRAADPALAHDPFSSLMWILFSLPSPFLSSVECFLYLVHLFYAVCVIQAIITYIGKYQFDITEFGDSLVSDLYKIVGEYGFTLQYFVSNYIDDTSCHPKDMIRRLSHPYLRRCALLWKLLRSSTPAPFSADRSHKRIRLSLNLKNDISTCPTAFSEELVEVEALEHMFQIPNLDVIVKDNMMRSLGLKWFHHFSREYETRNYGRTLHTTPATPFRLIRLPHVYQDLLERYSKEKCPECGAVQDEPALCLLCGRICSPNWIPCCGELGAKPMQCLVVLGLESIF